MHVRLGQALMLKAAFVSAISLASLGSMAQTYTCTILWNAAIEQRGFPVVNPVRFGASFRINQRTGEVSAAKGQEDLWFFGPEYKVLHEPDTVGFLVVAVTTTRGFVTTIRIDEAGRWEGKSKPFVLLEPTSRDVKSGECV